MPPTAEAGRIRELRERLLARLLTIIAVAGALAYGPSAYLSIHERLWVILVVDTIACLSAVCLALIRGLPFRLKVGYLIGLAYVLGVLLLAYTGEFGAGHLFLFGFVFLAALFGDVRGMVAANVAAVLTYAAFYGATVTGVLHGPQGSWSVLVISVNAVLIGLVLSVSASYLLRGYAAAASEEERLRQAVEMMLKELEHRVKNNLQVISSLISLRVRSAEDPRRALEEIRESVSALVVVHHLLYRQSGANQLSVKALLGSLVERFRNLFRDLPIAFEWNGPDLQIDGDRAVSLGLMVNEIVMNSSKHAFADGDKASVAIRIDHDQPPRRMVLSVGDNGRGMEPDAAEGVGLQMIRALARQLGAEMEVTFSPSVRYRFRIQLDGERRGARV